MNTRESLGTILDYCDLQLIALEATKFHDKTLFLNYVHNATVYDHQYFLTALHKSIQDVKSVVDKMVNDRAEIRILKS